MAALAILAPHPATAGRNLLAPVPNQKSGVRKYVMDVRVGTGAPDCVSRPVILVNGLFQPTITVKQGEILEVKVMNNLPLDWPTVATGITVHWHGFHLRGYEWYDGTAYVAQCPIKPGKSFTYRFMVDETPGTYWWHDHGSLNRADGLQGALIVLSKKKSDELYQYDADRIMFLQDHWQYVGNALAVRLNRPFDAAKATNDTGNWFWVGLPKSNLVNGKGVYYDCEDPYDRVLDKPMWNGADATAADLLTPPAKAGQLGPTAAWTKCDVKSFYGPDKKCRHEVIKVNPNTRVLVRLINAATLVYQTVCFEKHDVTVVAMDGNPVKPITFRECVDINMGQRVDVLIRTYEKVDNYWISVLPQYRKGAPAGYAVLNYKGAPVNSLPGAGHAVVQPQEGAERKWTMEQTMSVQGNPILVNPSLNPAAAAPYILHGGVKNQAVPGKVDQRLVMQVTQPLLESNGIVKWALSNVIHADTPPCEAVLNQVYENDNWVADNAIQPTFNGLEGYYTFPMSGVSVQGPADTRLQVVSNDALVTAKTPKYATHTYNLKMGDVVEIIVQNNRAGAFGGEYGVGGTTNRVGREQHPLHLHGHRFWVVGVGNGTWSPSDVATYNTKNPVYRDTATVFMDGTTSETAGWLAVRFIVDNPGVWPFHCHIAWHQFMGQAVNFIVGKKADMTEPPKDMPHCSDKCYFSLANYSPKKVEAAFGTKYLAPDDSNLSPVRLNAGK